LSATARLLPRQGRPPTSPASTRSLMGRYACRPSGLRHRCGRHRCTHAAPGLGFLLSVAGGDFS
jgi:hypothetical protein